FMVSQGVAAILYDARKPFGLLNMWGSWEDRHDRATGIPGLIVSNDHISMLHPLLERGITPIVQLRTTGRFVPGRLKECNTVGEIRGSERPDEVVLVGGHLDSWDLGQGTTDNGTGSITVLEAGRLVKATGIRPKRTIRFVLFAGEEEA